MTTLAPRKYDLTQSPFYKVTTKKKLSNILRLENPSALKKIVRLETPYRKFDILQKGKMRPVQVPTPELLPIHNRIFSLLKRLELPDYLHSGAKGRSYVSNAAAHRGTKKTYTTDIAKFYPSVTREKVETFFRDTMKCSVDVAAILSIITTCDDHIPTGSALSQLLAYFACKEMFDEIHRVSIDSNVVMTCYVDDLSFSGDAVTRAWIYGKIKKIITRHGLRSHKDKFFGPGKPKEITGIIVDGNTLKVMNRLHKSIHDLTLKIAETEDLETLNKLFDSLIGKLSSAGQVDDKFKTKRKQTQTIRRDLVAAESR